MTHNNSEFQKNIKNQFLIRGKDNEFIQNSRNALIMNPLNK